jgi:hypothetical protein
VNCQHYEGVDTGELTLVADPVVSPKLFSNFKGKMFILTYGHPLMAWIEKNIGAKGLTNVGGSVVTTCFELAGVVRGDPVIFVGLDLSFPNGLPYSRCTAISENFLGGLNKFLTLEMIYREFTRRIGMVWIEDIFGGRVLTSHKMLVWLRWIESHLSISKARFIDATEGGARIKGTEVMTLKEAITRFCRRPIRVQEVLEKAKMRYKPPSTERLTRELMEVASDWRRLKEIAKEGLFVSRALLNESSQGTGDERNRAQLSLLGNILNKALGMRRIMGISRWEVEPLIQTLELGEGSSTPQGLAARGMAFFSGLYRLSQEAALQFADASQGLARWKLGKG